MKKRSFLLLEILIAFTLVTVCIVPLVKQPLKLYKREIEELEVMEMERLADWTFTEIKEIFLKNEISWDQIPGKGERSSSFPMSEATLEIPACKDKKIQREFHLTGRGEKQGLKGEIYRQLGVYVFLNKKKYTFRLPVQKIKVSIE